LETCATRGRAPEAPAQRANRREVLEMSKDAKKCEKGKDPKKCGPEQIRECHGEAAKHSCGAPAGKGKK